jgi:ribose-phosphate pyrophosphokinase
MTSALTLRNDFLVISTIDNLELAKKVANQLDIQFMQAHLQIFSDGESKVQMNQISDNGCIIIHSTHPPVDQHLMQLFMMVHKCTNDHAKDICIISPYIAYSRQDKEFLNGEVISIDVMGKILECIGCKELVTVDIHNPNVLSRFVFKTYNISAIPLLAEYTRNHMHLNDPLIISPDNGGINRAEQLANILSIEMSWLTKTRDRYTGKIKTKYEGTSSISHRDIIIIDDMISTGNSIINAAKILKELGAEKLFVLCTHALLLEDAAERLLAAGITDIIATNSIPNIFAKVDLSTILSDHIRKYLK